MEYFDRFDKRYVHKKGTTLPWKVVERKHPVSDVVKKKYLHPEAYTIDYNGKVQYNVKSIQRMPQDYVLSYCNDDTDRRQYNDLNEIITWMYRYRDRIKR
jgi:hypothetical protein